MLPTSMGEADEIIKDSFRNIILDVLVAELDSHGEYEKYKQVNCQKSNFTNHV